MLSPPEIQQAATAALRKMGADIETKKTVLAPPTVAVWGEDGYFFPCSEVTSGMVLDITIDGVTRRGTAVPNEKYGGMIAVVFDIGDFVYIPNIAMGNVYVNDVTESMPDATISVVAVNETIHPIDPKYLFTVFKSVLDFGDAGEYAPALELSKEFKAELNTAPNMFLARCKQTAGDGNVFSVTAMFLPMELEGIMTGYNAAIAFPSSSMMLNITIGNMSGEWMCQVTTM